MGSRQPQDADSGPMGRLGLIPFWSRQAARAKGPASCDAHESPAGRNPWSHLQSPVFTLPLLCLIAAKKATKERGDRAWEIWVAVSLAEDGSLQLYLGKHKAREVLCRASHVRRGRDGLPSFIPCTHWHAPASILSMSFRAGARAASVQNCVLCGAAELWAQRA